MNHPENPIGGLVLSGPSPRGLLRASSLPLTFATLLAIEAVGRMGMPVTNPATIYLAVVIYATVTGGLPAGFASAALTLAYTAWSFSAQEPLFASATTARRFLILGVSIPFLVLMVGLLRRRVLLDHQHARSALVLQAQLSERQQAQAADALLHEIDRRVLHGQAVRDLLPFICSWLADAYDYPLVWIGMKEADGSISIRAHAGTHASYLEGLNVRWDDTPEGRGPAGEAIRHGQTQVAQVHAPGFAPWLQRARAHGLEAVLAVPLGGEGEQVGVLVLYSERADRFDAATTRRLENLATRINVALVIARHQEQLRLQGAAMAAAANAILITDRHGRVEWVNQAFTRLTGFTPAEVVGQRARLFQWSDPSSNRYREFEQTVLAGRVWRGELVERSKSGELFTVEQTVTPLHDASGAVTHLVAIHEDITAQKRAEARIEHLAHHDPLTDLPNRLLFGDRVRQALAQARRGQHLVALFSLDLDRFQAINDSLGHDCGDEVLRQVARRLRSRVREGDTVARLGNDEFTVLIPALTRASDAADIAHKLLHALTDPFQIGEHELYVTASIGIALFPLNADDADSLIRAADVAMYRAKELGGNVSQFHTAEMNAQMLHRLLLETSLRKAIERGELLLHYQPQVDLRSGRVVGVEALVRWQHPDLGLVLPAQFIALAEETGLIVPLGEWVLTTACRQCRAWQEAGLPPLQVAVNLSSRQFRQRDLLDLVRRALATTGLAPDRLELELTETTVMEDAEAAVHALRELKALGIHLAIDDFGTGYSSLSYLSRLPAEKLKIDRSFIEDLPTKRDSLAIVEAIIAMAHCLKLRVVAEGVEEPAQLAALRELGCDQAQGYAVGRPLPADELARFLASAS